MIVAKAVVAIAIGAAAFAPIGLSAEPALPKAAVVRVDFDSSKILASRADG